METCTDEQKAAIKAVLNGDSIFLTGPGGSGKSYLLEVLRQEFKKAGKVLAITAMTGCAALLLGTHAKTLHSWAGIGLGKGSVDSIMMSIHKNGRHKKNWRDTECLVIDEVSMLTPQLLALLDQVGQRVRKSREAFGGLQLVFVGDFYQLPPIYKEEKVAFAFQSDLWKMVVKSVHELKTIHRQKDPVFQTILNEARIGELSDASYTTLEDRKSAVWKGQPIRPTMLFTRNEDIDTINRSYLGKLTGEEHIFKATTGSAVSGSPEEIEYRVQKLDKDAPYETVLCLKVGAQVMLIHNTSVELGLVNGSRGVVKGFDNDGAPLVKFMSCLELRRVEPVEWKSDGDVPIVRKQVPLRVAYALTIHKAQGASLDSALVDIGPSTFEYGQAYVALSRVRSLEALYVHDLDRRSFKVHPAVKEFYETLRKD